VILVEETLEASVLIALLRQPRTAIRR